MFGEHSAAMASRLNGNVRRREDARLGVMNAEAFDVGQVADAAGDGDVDVVLDAAGLGTVADAQVGVALIGAERHEDDLGPALDGDARHLRKFDVVADGDGDLALVGVEHLDAMAPLDAPPVSVRSA